ncbi:polysaccharide deacetylase family protein [soil metagenome]
MKIFLFHRVSPERDPLWDPMSPKLFDATIEYIKRKYTIIQLEKFLLNKKNDHSNTEKYAAIVFDDGYKDFLEYALPVLKKHECPASMYIVTDCVNKQSPPWTYILDYHFTHSKKLNIPFNLNLLPSHLKTTTFKDVKERMEFAKIFKPFLKTTPNQQRVELYETVISALNDVTIPDGLIMNWNELKQIKAEGIEIGSHSVSHPLLAKIETIAELTNELINSGQTIEKNLGHFPITISYPIGSYNEQVKKIASENGYKIGLAVNQISYQSKLHDQFEIPRIELYNESFFKTKLRISGIVQTINNWRR